jgi:hypothetical protein
MRKIPYFLIVFLATALFSSCINGKGELVTETLGINGFTKIDHGTKGDVVLVKDDNQFVVLTGQQNILDILNITVDGGTLKIRTKGGKSINKYSELKFEVHAPVINEIKVSGPGTVTGGQGIAGTNLSAVVSGSGKITLGEINAQKTEAIVSGSGSILLSGISAQGDMGIGSSGRIEAFGLTVADNKTEMRGNGVIETTTNNSLEVRILGMGTIRYKGYPTITTPVNNGQGFLVNAN